ncbi:MAG: hypothetical protein QME25_00555 [Bacteroidota bacterium]|nr:hypothetical protein [Bacteroidota bacterium]
MKRRSELWIYTLGRGTSKQPIHAITFRTGKNNFIDEARPTEKIEILNS